MDKLVAVRFMNSNGTISDRYKFLTDIEDLKKKEIVYVEAAGRVGHNLAVVEFYSKKYPKDVKLKRVVERAKFIDGVLYRNGEPAHPMFVSQYQLFRKKRSLIMRLITGKKYKDE
ncbi:hypothetical protein [Priestia megaterium]|uniref:hypothetical protein n=1 Tax=Priestia megaterium TaxID=1404 RepID=UPI000BED12A1|nr:hypothetical protein [Priestia megaterium]PED63989.1 hypothetical protein CON20_23790 [Priestia megaterium]